MITRRAIVGTAAASVLHSVADAATGLPPAIFATLWKNHPMGDDRSKGDEHPCADLLKPACFEGATLDIRQHETVKEQCAVRMGVTLKRTINGVTFDDLPQIAREDEAATKGHPRICRVLVTGNCGHPQDHFHIIDSTELAKVFDVVSTPEGHSQHPRLSWVGSKEEYHRSIGKVNDFRTKLKGRFGIIFIKDYWKRPGETTPTGCHIDLWHGGFLRTKRELFDFGKNGPPEKRFDEVASKVVFWPVS
jgi:type VI secretion system (T6SS) effector Tae4 (amidase)